MFIAFADDTNLGRTALKGEIIQCVLERLEKQTSPRYQSQTGTIY